MQSILITGAHGFIGRNLARYCSEHWPAKITGLGHGTFSGSELGNWGLTNSLNGDVSFANLDRVAAESGVPEIIFHLAGGNSVAPSLRIPQEDFRRSVTSTCELLDWVRLNAPSARVVLASSAAVYGSGHCQPINEATPATPYSPYGYHKRMAELLFESYAQSFSLDTRIVRFFSVYGPQLRKQLLWDTCQRLASGQQRLQMHGTGKEQRDWLHINDCVSFLALVGSRDCPRCLINGGTGQATSVEQIVALLCHHWNPNAQYEFIGDRRPGDPINLVADIGQARAWGWQPEVNWRDGIADYVSWYRSNVG